MFELVVKGLVAIGGLILSALKVKRFAQEAYAFRRATCSM